MYMNTEDKFQTEQKEASR